MSLYMRIKKFKKKRELNTISTYKGIEYEICGHIKVKQKN
jgi:hypothetical protein